MKKILVLLIQLSSILAFGQYQSATIKIGGGYGHDFPGLNGYVIYTECARSLTQKLEGGIGIRWTDLNGFPRTKSVSEYTRAVTADFHLYFVALSNEVNALRVGGGYSFSFYKIRRSYPLVVDNGTGPQTTWPVQDEKGRSSGISLLSEYEYFIPGGNFSVGLRGSLFKAYDYVLFGGAFVGIRI